MSTSNKHQLIINLSTLGFIIFPGLGIIIPLIIWKSRDKMCSETDYMAKELINFQITWLLAWFTGIVLISLRYIFNFWKTFIISRIDSWITSMLTYVICLYIINLIFIIINTVRIQKRKPVKYRPSFRFIQ